jgi:LEA14-like dessication related protein
MKKKIKWIILGTVLLLIAVVAYLGLTFKAPEFAGLDGIEIEGMKGKKLESTIQVKIYNPNFYGLSAAKLDYIVTYRDTVLGRGSLPKGLTLEGGDTNKLQLPVTLELDGVFAVHQSMLRKPKCKLDIHLEGEFTFLHIQQGLDLQAEIEPTQFIKDILGKSLDSEALHLEEMEWKSSKLQTSEFSFVSVVKNPFDIPLDLQALDLKLYNTGSTTSLAGEWKLAQAVPLKPQYSTRVPGTIELSHLGTGRGVATSILTGELRFDARGLMVLQLATLPFEVPIEGVVIIHPTTGEVEWGGGEE